MLALFAVLVTACQKEETGISDDSNELNQLLERTQDQIKAFEENGEFGQFFSDSFLYNKPSDKVFAARTALCSTISPDSNNLLSCATPHQLPPFVNYSNTFWDVIENKKGSIDKSLEHLFNTSLDFSSLGWPVGPV